MCVRGLQIDGVDLPLDDEAAFERGWHGLVVYSQQHRQRWSQASARLPDGTRLVVIQLGARSYCWAQPQAEAASSESISALSVAVGWVNSIAKV